MEIYEDDNVAVSKSSIEGFGVFAKRVFKKGEVVLRWNPKRLTTEEIKNIPEGDKRYINKLEDGSSALMQVPERFVNSSENPNTQTVHDSDVALRDIEVGEEITSSYIFG